MMLMRKLLKTEKISKNKWGWDNQRKICVENEKTKKTSRISNYACLAIVNKAGQYIDSKK